MNYNKIIGNTLIGLLAVGLITASVIVAKERHSKKNKPAFKVGECLVRTDISGGFYQVKRVTKNSYIMRAYGTYIRIRADIPIVLSKKQPLEKVDCMKDIQEEYIKVMKEIQEDIISKRAKRFFLPRKGPTI